MADAQPADTSRGVGRAMLAGTALAWALFVVSLAPAGADWGYVRGALAGCFAGSLVYGTIAGAAVWAAIRTRRAESVWAAVLALPLAAACRWRLLAWGPLADAEPCGAADG
jgi:hypothetical protein